MDTSDNEPGASVGFEHYVFVLRRQWKVLVAGAILGVLVAAVYLAAAPTVYTATTTVNVTVITTDPFSPTRPASGLLDDVTEVGIAESAVVATIAAKSLPELTVAEVRSSTKVTLFSDATVATVRFTSAQPELARQGADAVAAAYLEYRSGQAADRVQRTVNNLDVAIDALDERLVGVNEALASSEAGSAAAGQAASEREQIQLELQSLLFQRNQLLVIDTNGGWVLSPAADNDLTIAPGKALTLATGFAAGLAVGVVGAFIINPFDRRLRNEREIVRAANAPTLARLRSASGNVPFLPADEDALRVARERVLSEIRQGTARILVMDLSHDVGVSAHAVNFAIVTAQSHRDTLLIAPELTAQQLIEWSDALGIDDDQPEVRRSTRLPWLSVYFPVEGDEAATRNDADRLFTRQVRAVLDDVAPGTICILVVTAQAHLASQLAALREADAAIVLAKMQSATTTEIGRFVAEASEFETPILGVLTAPADKTRLRKATLAEAEEMQPLPVVDLSPTALATEPQSKSEGLRGEEESVSHAREKSGSDFAPRHAADIAVSYERPS